LVKSVLTPSQLLTRAIPTSRANAIPALRALDVLKERGWKAFFLGVRGAALASSWRAAGTW
jgi:hypothetical protein